MIGSVVSAYLRFFVEWGKGPRGALGKLISWQYQLSVTASKEEG